MTLADVGFPLSFRVQSDRVAMTVIGILFESRLPNFNPGAYDTRITEGLVGVVVSVEEGREREIEAILNNAGAMETKRA